MSFLHSGIDPLFTMELSAVLRILIAAILGATLGFERSLAGKHAGMRTYALVALGSALFIISGELLALMTYGSTLDPSRIAASVIMGIGFIGSGLTLFHRSEDRPGEITTAAGIWVAAGIGIVTGFGFYTLAVGVTLITILVFTLLIRLEDRVRNKYTKNDRNVPSSTA